MKSLAAESGVLMRSHGTHSERSAAANTSLNESVAHYASGAFETIGSAANVAGLIPVVGNIALAIGIAADASERGIKRRETKKQWYLVGPKMREVAIKELLGRF